MTLYLQNPFVDTRVVIGGLAFGLAVRAIYRAHRLQRRHAASALLPMERAFLSALVWLAWLALVGQAATLCSACWSLTSSVTHTLPQSMTTAATGAFTGMTYVANRICQIAAQRLPGQRRAGA